MSANSERFWDGAKKWLSSVKIDSISIGGIRFGFRSDSFNTPSYQQILDILETSKNRKNDVFIVTAHNMDEVYSVDSILSDHECDSDIADRYPGGAGANTAFALGTFGRRVSVTGSVGSDDLADELLSHLSAAGVGTDLVVRCAGSSGRTITIVEDSGRRLIVVRQGANKHFHEALNYEDIIASINNSRVLHASSFVDEGGRFVQQRLFSEADGSVIRAITPGAIYASLGLDRLEGLFRHSHIIFMYKEQLMQAINKSTARNFLKGDSVQSLITAYFAWKTKIGFKIPQIIIIKSPLEISSGMLTQSFLAAGVGDQELEKFIPPRTLDRGARYRALDTTGAGDSCAAGFIHSILSHSSIEHAVDSACVMAALASTAYGARTGFENISSPFVGKTTNAGAAKLIDES